MPVDKALKVGEFSLQRIGAYASKPDLVGYCYYGGILHGGNGVKLLDDGFECLIGILVEVKQHVGRPHGDAVDQCGISGDNAA